MNVKEVVVNVRNWIDSAGRALVNIVLNFQILQSLALGR